MQNVILVVHIIACIVMTIVIMLQKSEGGALGIGGGGGGLMTGRGAAGALVRVTMIFGGIFFITSLGLTTLANRGFDDSTLVERAAEQNNPIDAPLDLDSGGIINLDPEAETPTSPAPTPSTTETPIDLDPPVETPEPADDPQ